MREENAVENGGEEAGSTRGPITPPGVPSATTPSVLPNRDHLQTDANRPLTPTLSPDGGEGETVAATQHTRASVGKIARLPKTIREMLNRRLDDGEPTSSLAAWLNELPPVQTVLASYFGGAAISEKNISNWRLTGFKRWQERQESLLEVKELAEEASDLNETTTDGLMRITATLTCRKLLKLLKDEKTTAAEVVKIGFAIAALNNVEMSHVRVEHEDRRLQQKDEMVSLAYDKHYRNCAEIADRIKGDEQIEMVKQAEIDNRDKIELIGRRMFGNLWKKRRLPWEDENFNKDEEELERMEAERRAGSSPEDGGLRADEADWTDGTDEPEDGKQRADVPANPYEGKTTQQLIAEAESLSRNCRNTTGETPVPLAESEQKPQAPKRELSDYDTALLEGKTHEEASYAQFTPVEKPKEKPPEVMMYPKPNPLDSRSEPVHYTPQPGPTRPLYGPAEPPLTLSTWYNLRPPPGWNSLG